MSANAALVSTGCGCGGGGGGSASGGGGCGCGGACGGGTATADLAATAFVRPRFFAGQLLTEDDLGALTSYVTAKDRLHNRYLSGGGVVCGLWVNCDPCGGGTITVQPGYALDCCGNDLILPCAATLDVNAMIRDLRAAQLGKDCGDPCAGQGTASSGRQDATPARHYRLYARYGEQATDPVAPYATGEPCGQLTCEPTRIREGISFVLRCPADTTPPDDLWSRLSRCLASDAIVRQAARLKAYGGPMLAAVAAAARPLSSGRPDADEVDNVRAGLAGARSSAGEDQGRSAVEYVRRLAAILAGYDLARDRAEPDGLPDARADLRDAAAALAAAAPTAGYDPADQAAVNALLDQAVRLADPAAAPSGVRLAMLAQGKPLDDPVLAGLASDAAAVREWLLDRLDSEPALTDCRLRPKVQALSLTTTAEDEVPAIRFLGRAWSELAVLFTAVLRDCVCAALNPPCAPCDDTDVLLACVEVRDCTVVRICNAERDYVISGSALRYWLPTGLIHQGLEFLCCPPDRGADVARADPARLAFSEAGFGAGASAADLSRDLLGLPDLGRMLRDAVDQVAAARAAPAGPKAAPAPPAASEAAADAMAKQIAALADRVTALTGQLTDTQAKLSDTQAQLGDTQASLGDTQAQLGNTQAKLGETEGRLGEAEAKLGEAEGRLGETETKLGETEAKLGETQANLRQTQDDLGKTQVSLSALSSQSQPQASQPPPVQASPRRRSSAAGRPAAAGATLSAPSVPSAPSDPNAPSAPSAPSVPSVPSVPSAPSAPSVPSDQSPAGAGTAPADSGTAAAGTDTPESSDDT